MHEHEHEHEPCDRCQSVKAQTVAMLRYMLEHNRHHADELHELAHDLDGSARELVCGAVIDIERSNDKLAEALKAIETDGASQSGDTAQKKKETI